MSEFVFLFRTSAADRREAMGTPERAQLEGDDGAVEVRPVRIFPA